MKINVHTTGKRREEKGRRTAIYFREVPGRNLKNVAN